MNRAPILSHFFFIHSADEGKSCFNWFLQQSLCRFAGGKILRCFQMGNMCSFCRPVAFNQLQCFLGGSNSITLHFFEGPWRVPNMTPINVMCWAFAYRNNCKLLEKFITSLLIASFWSAVKQNTVLHYSCFINHSVDNQLQTFICHHGYALEDINGCFSEQSFEKLHGEGGQPVFRDLPGLCADTPKHSRVARAEGSIRPEPQRVSGVDLWRHLPFKGVLGPTQCATTRIDS